MKCVRFFPLVKKFARYSFQILATSMLLCVKQTANAGIASIISWLLQEMGGMVAVGTVTGS